MKEWGEEENRHSRKWLLVQCARAAPNHARRIISHTHTHTHTHTHSLMYVSAGF